MKTFLKIAAISAAVGIGLFFVATRTDIGKKVLLGAKPAGGA